MNDATSSGPWDPGIESPVPRRLRHLCTVFRRESSYTRYEEAHELRGFTGLDYIELVAFRPERLALHELLIRVSADLTVPDGEKIEDLGINFRAIVRDVLAGYIEPRLDEVTAVYAACRGKLAAIVTAELGAAFESTQPREAIARWEREAHAADGVRRAALRAVARTVSAVIAKHGRLWGTPDLLAAVALTLALNEHAAEEIGRTLDPWLADAVRERALRVLPRQERPVVMNTKGASASGKSTIRPLQRRLAGEIGTDWQDFALISPDIWRKQLLDYASLGVHYKYAGAFTGDELQVIDRKLDHYMARKATRGGMSHLLIDRFRFDSFAPDSDVAGSNLLTRFGQIVYLFFMITPPASLVERAWNRGLEVGRYKAVDDTLAHGVEAYSGMPELFFTWIERTDKRVHFEFLDNTVPLGEPPRTVAFGWNDRLTIFSVQCLLDVERYRRVDINARAPDDLFRDESLLAPENNLAFLRECVARFRRVSFADAASGRVYLALEAGSAIAADAGRLRGAAEDADTRAGLAAVAPGVIERASSLPMPDDRLQDERVHTLGSWQTRV
ncbi:MAG TPA: hypothetical protein VHP37_01095 [Burkholderiales bacterium]|nr:hypothetical protein [Burkholderiales bacterium]